MHDRVEHRREAVAERLSQLLLAQRLERGEQTIARPVVIVDQRLQHVEGHRCSSCLSPDQPTGLGLNLSLLSSNDDSRDALRLNVVAFSRRSRAVSCGYDSCPGA